MDPTAHDAHDHNARHHAVGDRVECWSPDRRRVMARGVVRGSFWADDPTDGTAKHYRVDGGGEWGFFRVHHHADTFLDEAAGDGPTDRPARDERRRFATGR